MSLAALIAAYHESDEPGGGLRATLPLAGRTLIERQARLAASVGANPIVVLVERVPAPLLAAIDRLRGEGMKLVVARNAVEAAEAVHPDDRLLMMADGLVAGEDHLDRLLSVGPPTILTVPDMRVDDRFERIDAHSRWAGLALLEGQLLKRTAAMLQDWDLQSTLLRRAVQGGARQLSLRGEASDDHLTVAEQGADLADLQDRILAGAQGRKEDWVSAYLLAPIEQSATRLLMPTAFTAGRLAMIEAGLLAGAVAAFAADWLWIGMLLLVLATPLGGTAERLAALRMQLPGAGGWLASLSPLLGAAALLILSVSLAKTAGWGCVAVAVTAIAFLAALRVEIEGKSLPGRIFFAERKGMTWLMLPFAMLGLWATGLCAVALYAAGSFFWAQRQTHRTAPAGKKD